MRLMDEIINNVSPFSEMIIVIVWKYKWYIAIGFIILLLFGFGIIKLE